VVSGVMVRRWLALSLVVAMAWALSAGASAAVPAGGPSFGDAGGIHVVSQLKLTDRDYNVNVLSPALGRAVNVRFLLPADYAQHPTTRYPVLYLYHGTSGWASDWIQKGDATATTAGLPVITVMPDAGFNGDGGGWFTNWVDSTTTEGPSKWETFHVAQLIPWVDHNLRTIAQRRGRAIAGLSQGGFGSFTYAARHPDTFVSAASFSGAPEIDRDPDVIIGATAVIEATAKGLDGVQPEAMFGSRVTNEINWQGHDPATLIPNLRGMSLNLWTATGAPGPYDSAPNPGGSGIESLTHASSQHFHDHLVAAGIPSYYNDYTYGTHTWPYWSRDLREYAPMMMTAFSNPPRPASVTYMSIDQQWTQWGWTVSLTRGAAQEFSSITDAGHSGFTLQGSGIARVTTPAAYRPGSIATITIASTSGIATSHLRVGRDGRLVITVPLGPGSAQVTIRT
jgi:S-formylglutathione hydrolase FrmB